MTSEKVEKGDIIYLEIDSWIVNPDGTRKLHDTTREELAKQEKIHEEKRVYGESPAIVGHSRLPLGLEEQIIGKDVGEEGEVVVPPEKGAGNRDPKLVSLHSIREFVKLNMEPEIGMPVVIGGRRGYISAVTAGRVRVDYNNPLACKTLNYKYKITKKAGTLLEKISALIEMDYGLGEQFKIKTEGDEADVMIPDLSKTDERWMVAKFRIVADIREIGLLRKIRFIEEYEKKEEKKEEAHEHKEPPKSKGKTEQPKKKVNIAEEELTSGEKAPEEL